MHVLILAAGYATRLYPLTLTQPKPLLPVAGKPMINYVLDNLASIEGLDRVYVVTNAKFAGHFESWARNYQPSGRESPHPSALSATGTDRLVVGKSSPPGRGKGVGPLERRTQEDQQNLPPKLPITIVNDGSTDDSNKLGAIGDIHFVLEQEQLADDLIVVAGDNLFSHDLKDFGAYCREKNTPVLAAHDVKDLDLVRKYSVVNMDQNSRITLFEEKPKQPTSTLIGIALYFYPKETLPLIRQYVREGNNPDQPGRLIQWMYQRVPVHAWTVPSLWYDIGSKETLEEANRVFAKK
ncbi:MAG: nucleotidyltransferase family protein [Verrucomicrobia bacterium]|nr:nucleotidyltransferase family protein [Verrucomicrobiota bacterium]